MSQNGALGERFAADYLEQQGYTVLTTNFRTRFGEIDIIAQKGDILAFVEVKTRASTMLEPPEAAVTPSKRKKIVKTALYYLQAHPTGLQPRFDVVAITTKSKASFEVLEILHLTDAFEAATR